MGKELAKSGGRGCIINLLREWEEGQNRRRWKENVEAARLQQPSYSGSCWSPVMSYCVHYSHTIRSTLSRTCTLFLILFKVTVSTVEVTEL
jgi:hypothetical protein